MAGRPGFGDLLTPGFRKIYNDAFKEVPLRMDDIFNMNTSDKDTEKDSSIAWFSLAQQTGEGEPIDYEEPVQGYDVSYAHLKYTKGFKITLEMYEDDLYSIMNKRPEALGRSMRRTAEYWAASVFNNGFSTSYLGGDGKPLFSTTHARPDGGSSQSNASATGITLTDTNLETAMIANRKQLDDRGQKIGIMPNTLVIPVDLRKTARLIIDSPLRSGTADNDTNVYKGEFKIIDWLYITSTTAWFLLDSSQHELNWFWRKKPEFKSDELFDTEYAVYKSTMRFSKGWSDWRATWGSKGDGAAYSS